ncbi:hypothetical protein BGW38_005174 [Lunasporangiospora selenospora]|uniref:RNA helicase n=1 Tax=Lunasporangiospora selenospora TaxID=979761 RepID=A0A9P6G053_9FUNG|nr:hypothetical protein BGW38_005174 [Lunasporangiospora selenospora]
MDHSVAAAPIGPTQHQHHQSQHPSQHQHQFGMMQHYQNQLLPQPRQPRGISQNSLETTVPGFVTQGALNRPTPAHHGQAISRRSLSIHSNGGSFVPLPSMGASSAHQTPNQNQNAHDTVSRGHGGDVHVGQLSRTPSPGCSPTHSPPLPNLSQMQSSSTALRSGGSNNSNNHDGGSSGGGSIQLDADSSRERLTPVGLLQGSLFDQGFEDGLPSSVTPLMLRQQSNADSGPFGQEGPPQGSSSDGEGIESGSSTPWSLFPNQNPSQGQKQFQSRTQSQLAAQGLSQAQSLQAQQEHQQYQHQQHFQDQASFRIPNSVPHAPPETPSTSSQSSFGAGGYLPDAAFGSFTPSATYQNNQRFGRPLSSQFNSMASTPIVAPQPSRQRVLQHTIAQPQGFMPFTPGKQYQHQQQYHHQQQLSHHHYQQQFNQQHQPQYSGFYQLSPGPHPLPQNQLSAQQQHQQHQQQQSSYPQSYHQQYLPQYHALPHLPHQTAQQHQHSRQSQHQQNLQTQAAALSEATTDSRGPLRRTNSEESQASVVKLPPGYFPIYNGSEWVMISHGAALVAGIPIPHPQTSPSHGVNNMLANPRTNALPPNRLEDSSQSRSESPPAHAPLSRQGSETGRTSGFGVDMKRTASESRRGSIPQASSTRASSPSEYKPLVKSPTSGSPNHHIVRNEHSNAVQETLEFLDLLQKYDYLNAWTRHGKSVTPSDSGSPVDSASVLRRQEPFEKSLVQTEISEWIESHKDYLQAEKLDLYVPMHIDFGNVRPKSEPVIKTIRIENHGTKVLQFKALKIIPNAHHQVTCLMRDSIIVHPADGTEPMFGNIDISLATGDREMDPFAKAYTPQWLRNLNLLKTRMVIKGEQVETIDFQEYLKACDHPCYKKHNGKFSLEPPAVEPLEVILPGQITVDLSADSYASRLQPLLQVEKHLFEEDVSSYNLYMVEIKVYDAASNFFQIQVGGLSEKCPLLLRGDSIIVRQVTNGVFTGIEYRTFVHGTNMRTNSVYVHLPIGALPSLVHERWNIQFKVNNNRISEMYRAVGGVQEFIGYHPRDPAQDTAVDGDNDRNYSPRSLLFPTVYDAVLRTKLPSLTLQFVDPSLNWEQKSAVESIVRNDYGMVPFVISGPPGTGKTKTLAETALQIIVSDTQSHILITAPSHSACDTIMLRLIPYLKPQYLFRLNDPSRTFAEVPTMIMPYCFGSVYFDIPPLDDLLQFRIVVCTCVDAGLLISAGASNQSLREYIIDKGLTGDKRSHWTHLLIDEAAQAIEPETDIPLLCILEETEIPPQVVLCGDHQQLGPKTFLPELQMSFLERLIMTEPLYREHPQSRQFARPKHSGSVTKPRLSKETEYLAKTIPCFANLAQNYRSHSKMLMMPSAMFYNDTLVASAEKSQTDSMLGCPLLPNPNCPIVFVGVKGTDKSQLDEAASWYNVAEAEQVASMIEDLMALSRDGNNDDVKLHVEVKDIGVIAPFREQVKLLRQLLRSKGLAGVNVGTVEDYQGQEYKIVLISTTRSRAKYLDQDVRQGLGLVHFRKRFNVALTRAMAMLVVVGNPELLVMDENWAAYLHFCLRNDAYTGATLPLSIVNPAHASGQKGAALMGRLEKNTLHEQDDDEYDDRGESEEEQEGGMGDDPQEEEDTEHGYSPLASRENYEPRPLLGHGADPGVVNVPKIGSENTNLGLRHQGAPLLLGEAISTHNGNGQDDDEDVNGEEEEESVRVARERLALGSLNIDEDTPDMQNITLSMKDFSFPTHGGQNDGVVTASLGQGQRSQAADYEEPNAFTAISRGYLSHQGSHQQQQQQQRQQHIQLEKSPVRWPSNDSEFKRMSSSKLVLERSFDPSEQDIFDDEY